MKRIRKTAKNFLSHLFPPQGLGPDGQNPRRHPRGPRELGRKLSLKQKKSWFFKNRACKVLPKRTQGIAETSQGVEQTLKGVWEQSLCTRFWSGNGRAVIKWKKILSTSIPFGVKIAETHIPHSNCKFICSKILSKSIRSRNLHCSSMS